MSSAKFRIQCNEEPTLNRISTRLTDLTHYKVSLIWSVGQAFYF